VDVVSVIIPCYKQAHFLGEAIESVQAQTHPRYEIIVIDDESPDNTAEVAGRYPNIRYFRQRRQERSAARNRGLRESAGDFVVFLDADDRLLPHHFQTCLDVFHATPELALVCGDYRWSGNESATHSHDCRPRPDYYGTLLRTNFIGALHAVMFRRDVLAPLGGFAPQLKSCEDQDLFLRVARSHPISCHHTVIAEYRWHDEQTSRHWDVMLESAMHMLQSHFAAVKGHASYEVAWREGMTRRQQMYGDPLLWAMVAAARQGNWPWALKFFRVLLRHYPKGLWSLIRHKAERLVHSASV
jgi:glycosyltransferase involved in cell wall biosynthesis